MDNFPAMTEEQRQALIEELREVIKVEIHSVYGYAARIALAALKPIELPCADHETDDGYEFYRKETVIEAIRAAGYEVAD